MDINYELSDEELLDLAKKENKSVDEVRSNYKYALKDLEYTINQINSIIDKNNYKRFPYDIDIYGYGKNKELENKYICSDQIKELKDIKKEDMAIVTGFGPTNSPTAGTLSSIFKVLELQRETGIYTHIVISELSALNSRQKPLDELFSYTKQFITFIKKLGFDESNGEIRSNNDLDFLRTYSIVASVFKVEDFSEGEATDDMYKRMNLLGNDYSTMVSQGYTVADIIVPFIRDKKKAVIVPAGLEEHLYPYLARVAIERMKNKTGGVEKLIDKDAKVGALYGKLISGLFPYVKMSKSIKESSINLGDTDEEIYNKIVECGNRNEEVILQMMNLASNWKYDKLQEAEKAFNNRNNDYDSWLQFKKEYCEFFKNVKKLWDESAPQKEINTYNELFGKEETQ